MKDLRVNFTFDVFKPMWLHAEIKQIQVGEMKTLYSSFGNVNDRLYTLGFNTLMEPEALMLPQLNVVI